MDQDNSTKFDKYELIAQAILYDNGDFLRELLLEDAKAVALRDGNGRLPLFHAIRRGSLKCARVLIEAGGDVNSPVDGAGKLPLILASELGNWELVEMLLSLDNIDLFCTDPTGHSALQVAQIKGHSRVVAMLMDHIEAMTSLAAQKRVELCTYCIDGNGASPACGGAIAELLRATPTCIMGRVLNGERDGEEKSALYLACENGCSDAVGALLAFEGHCIVFLPTGDTVLHVAIASQECTSVSSILNAFPSLMVHPNNDGSLPIHWAALCGSLPILKLLLEHPYPTTDLATFDKVNEGSYTFICDLNAVDSDGRTPLWLVVANGQWVLVGYMLEFKLQQRTSAHGTVYPASEPREEICPFLVDAYSNTGKTPLIVASAGGNIEIIRMLLQHGADVNLPIGALNDGDTSESSVSECCEVRCFAGSGALFEASRNRHTDAIQLLFSHGATDYDNRALHEAQKNDLRSVLPQFLARLSSIDAENHVSKLPTSPREYGALAAGLIASIYPSRGCQLTWQGAGIRVLETEWLIAACLQNNPKLRHHSKLALSAVTRIDLSNNSLEVVPSVLFQLPSLRVLNLTENCIKEIRLPVKSFQTTYLETLTIARNYLECLPSELFMPEHFPRLRRLDISGNCLRSLPFCVWSAPALVELIASDNEIAKLEVESANRKRSSRDNAAVSRRERTRGRETVGRTSAERGKSDSDRTPSVSTPAWCIDAECDTDITRQNRWQKEIALSNVEGSEERYNGEPEPSASDGASKEGVVDVRLLRSLNLAGNKMTEVPNFLACACPHLASLDMSMNELHSLGDVQSFPASLRHLNVSKNSLSELFAARRGREPPVTHCYFTSSPLHVHADTRAGVHSRQINESVNRHTRSRSKSVARNQRSMSVARSRADEADDACSHRSHCRLENLKVLNVSNNLLSSFDALLAMGHERGAQHMEHFNWRENTQKMRSYLLFPLLTTLDLSHNQLRALSPSISLHSYLAVLNLSQNATLEKLPPELGILDKLWSVAVKGCPLAEPLRSVIDETFKTSDVLGTLRAQLENSKLYSKMKLMLVGKEGVGKSTLLQQMRAEGRVTRGASQSEQTAKSAQDGKRGNESEGTSKAAMRDYPVDIWEWTYEPSKKSSSRLGKEKSTGPLTFRVWDFTGVQNELAAIQQYFYTRRGLFLVVWKVTDGDIALNELHEQLLAIQACAPNSTVLVVGTHSDFVRDHEVKFPAGYLEDLDRKINERFVNAVDAEKKGLPRVVGSIYMSKSRDDVKALCELVYHIAVKMPSPTRRISTLSTDRVPSSFISLEKICVRVADEIRAIGEEPILRFDDFLVLATTQILEEGGKPFRDEEDFRRACLFLHEHGVIVYFDDSFLRDYIFLDPQWLCALLRLALSPSKPSSNSSSLTAIIRQRPVLMTGDLFERLKFSLRQFDRHTMAVGANAGRSAAAMKCRLFRECLLNLLRKRELALPFANNQILLSSLLPDEYSMRANYSGTCVKVRSRSPQWVLHISAQQHRPVDGTNPNSASSSTLSPVRHYLKHRKLVRTLAYRYSIDEGLAALGGNIGGGYTQERRGSSSSTPGSSHHLTPTQKHMKSVHVEKVWQSSVGSSPLRRLYRLQYTPPGFWPRLTTRILDDERLATAISTLFTLSPEGGAGPHLTESMVDGQLHLTDGTSTMDIHEKALEELSAAFNTYCSVANVDKRHSGGHPPVAETSFIRPEKECCGADSQPSSADAAAEWHLWRTGVEIRISDARILSVKQFLPLAAADDVNYIERRLKRHSDESSSWCNLDFQNDNSLIEILIPPTEMTLEWEGRRYRVEVDNAISARVLAILSGIIDDLLEDWFPALGTRCRLAGQEQDEQNVRIYKHRLVVHTSQGQLLVERLTPCHQCVLCQDSCAADDKAEEIYLFSVDECIEASIASDERKLICPRHGEFHADRLAPDLIFADLARELIVTGSTIRRRKIMGHGAFGFVFSGTIRQKDHQRLAEVALKVLEPVEHLMSASDSGMEVALQAFNLKWRNEARENSARAYSLARQELNMLVGVRHPHVSTLIGFSPRPTTLIFELAPLGSLDAVMEKYLKSGRRIDPCAIQQTCVQIGKALECLHNLHHIIYRHDTDVSSRALHETRTHLQGFEVDECALLEIPYALCSVFVSQHHALKLGDYGISRCSYPSGVCKGYGGTEGFMAPEVIRYNGEQEYTELVDSYSFGMLIYELITLRQPYERQEQMKDFILEGRRPYVSEQELLLPTNVLDLMLMCWAERPELRPNSSQLVGICSAPEFRILLDVAVIDDGDQLTPNESGVATDSESVEGTANSCWLTQGPDGLLALHYSRYGWTRQENLKRHNSRSGSAHVTALCQVEDTIWFGYSTGRIEVYSCDGLSELSVLDVVGKNTDISERAIKFIAPVGDWPVMAVAQAHRVSLYRADTDSEAGASCPSTPLLLTFDLVPENLIHSVSPLTSTPREWQIWTGHEGSRIIVHHISASCDRQIYSTTITHPGPKRPPADSAKRGNRVRFIVSSRVHAGLCWSAMEDDPGLFMWRDSRFARSINCAKILPVSESLSTMSTDGGSCEAVTQMLLQGVAMRSPRSHHCERIILGTSSGLVMIVDALEMAPLTSFRPFSFAIEHIVACPTTSITDNVTANQLPSDAGNSREGEVPIPNDDPYFAVVGRGYRCLMERFSAGASESSDKRRCSIFCRNTL